MINSRGPRPDAQQIVSAMAPGDGTGRVGNLRKSSVHSTAHALSCPCTLSLPSRLHRFEQGVMEERNQRDKEVQEKKATCAHFKTCKQLLFENNCQHFLDSPSH